jgi:hypothetical protein
MNRIISAILFLLPAALFAQKVDLGPIVVAQNSASNLSPIVKLDLRGQKEVSIEWVVQHSGTATTTEGVQIRESVDGTNKTGRLLNMVATPASGTKVYSLTNVTVSGYPYLVISYITNGDADTRSTNWFKYWIKRNAP